MYIDFFLVFAWSHIKCKQHKASHNIIIAGPGPMRPRGTRHLITLLLPGPGRCAPEGLAKQSNANAKPSKAKQVKAMQRNATSHLFLYPYPQKPLHVTPFPLAVLQNPFSGCGVAKPVVLQNPLCC